MALTLRRMFNRPITRQYPEEKPVVAAGFSRAARLVRDAETGDSRCGLHALCAGVPLALHIRIRWSRAQDNSRVVDAYNIDALRCIFLRLLRRGLPGKRHCAYRGLRLRRQWPRCLQV